MLPTNQKSFSLPLFLLVSIKIVNSYWLGLIWFGLVKSNCLDINFVISDILNLKMTAAIPINGRNRTCYFSYIEVENGSHIVSLFSIQIFQI